MAKPNPAAVERAAKLDKTWFAGHPAETQRIRRIVPGEAGDIDPNCTHVAVERLAPGIRRKQFLREYEDLGEGEAPSDSPSEGIL